MALNIALYCGSDANWELSFREGKISNMEMSDYDKIKIAVIGGLEEEYVIGKSDKKGIINIKGRGLLIAEKNPDEFIADTSSMEPYYFRGIHGLSFCSQLSPLTRKSAIMKVIEEADSSIPGKDAFYGLRPSISCMLYYEGLWLYSPSGAIFTAKGRLSGLMPDYLPFQIKTGVEEVVAVSNKRLVSQYMEMDKKTIIHFDNILKSNSIVIQ